MMMLRVARSLAVAMVLAALAAGARLVQVGPLDVVPARLGGVAVGLRVDGLSAVLLCFVGCVGVLVATYSARNLVGQARTGRFGWLLLTALTALIVLVAGASLPVIAVGWTVSGLALAALVAQPGTAASLRGSRYVRRTLLIGDAAVWLGVLVALVLLPTVNRAELTQVAISVGGGTIVAALLLVGCVVRSALVPAQSWLPETAEAPSPVSAFLHAGIVNGAGVLVCLMWPLFVAAPAVLVVLLVVGAGSVMFGTLAARARTDVKGRLACSTTAQMGYMAVQLGLGLPAAAVLHLVGHGFYKAWLFLRAGGAISRSRWQPTHPVLESGERRTQAAAAFAALTVLVAAALAWPSAADSIQRLGPAAVLPLLLAAAAAVLGVVSVVGHRSAPTVTAGVAVTVGVAVAGYAWVLTRFEGLLALALPPVPVWPGIVAGALVIGVGAVGALIVLLLRSMAANPAGWWAVRLTGSALPPWTRTVSGTAAWPQPAGARDGGPKPLDAAEARMLVETAAVVCAPAWPLRTVVAANPLAHLELLAFDDAAALAGRLFGTRGYLPASAYQQLYADGRITRGHLQAAVRQRWDDRDQSRPEADLEAFVDGLVADLRSGHGTDPDGADPWSSRRLTDVADRREGPSVLLAAVSDNHAALWCQRAWSRALDDSAGPWQLWLRAASTPAYDRTLGLAGVSGLAREIPGDPAEALGWMLTRSGVPNHAHVGYVCALLTAAPGWAAHAAWRARQSGHGGPLLELVALRTAFDLLLAGSATSPVDHPAERQPFAGVAAHGWAARRGLWQAAYELGFQQPLVEQIQPRAVELAHTGQGTPAASSNVAAQLVFCIDVRSERLRRALEGAGPYATFGFAGFFGAVLSYRSPQGATFEQCPALVRPGFTVTAPGPAQAGLRQGLREGFREATLSVSGAPVTPLLLAEAGGALSGVASLAQTVLPAWWHRMSRAWNASTDRWGPAALAVQATDGHALPTQGSLDLPVGLTTREGAAVAADTLRTLGLVKGFAPLLVICGHGATVENNAFAAAYDCGACGGNSGHVNARVLAELLNDPTVRTALADDGIVIPSSTVAVAAVHDTTTDEVTIDPYFRPAPGHVDALASLLAALGAAGDAVRAERAVRLPGAPAHPVPPGMLVRHLRARAGDWAQPFPEWGLVGNAAFVIGPRALTRDLDLGGRVFLHDYHPDHDHDGAILETILTAPTIVTQWINAQYYASTVDHEIFGAGDKATHNVVGDVGVLSGAHGDLRLGLPWQALFAADPRHRPDTGQHEPLRQLVLAWAPPEAVRRIVYRHRVLQSLIGNDWMTLAVIDPGCGAVHRLTRHLTWQPWSNPAGTTALSAHRPNSSARRPVAPSEGGSGAATANAQAGP